MLPVNNLNSIISLYQNFNSYYYSLTDDDRKLLSVDVYFHTFGFKDTLIEPDINLFRKLSIVPQMCYGSNYGIILSHMFPKEILHQQDFIDTYIVDIANEKIKLEPSSKFNFIMNNRESIKNSICNDLFMEFGINKNKIFQLIKNDKNISTCYVIDLLTMNNSYEYILRVLTEIVENSDIFMKKFPTIYSLCLGRDNVTLNEFIVFIHNERINVLNILTTEDLISMIRNT